ncbi:MAG: hypothetical protein KAU01_10765, partial [Candidatus Cloacimonetes bacterium]|nr:hypothetical protein [Candidatus Cloacimonadota bacterium]
MKSRLSGKTLFFIFIFILLSSFLYATIIDVPIDYLTIQAAIDAAANSDTVLVRSDTYVENINYNGKLITVGSWFLTTQDTTYISQTIIDGNSIGSVVTFNNGEYSTSVLCGFTIINGSATFGGGIYCYNSSPSLQNVIISGNSATSEGGGIYCIVNSNPSLQNVTISGNSAYHGGGIYYYGSSPSLEDVTITGNSATSNGGGIYCYNSSSSLKNVTMSGNTASDNGGGIWCHNSSPSLENVTITDNSAEVPNGNGGGIYCCNYSNPSLDNITITGNTAGEGGGGICCYNYSSPSLQNVTISGNSASDHGGGILCSSSSPILENVTITVNYAWYGVGIYCDSSSPSLQNVTISGNTAGFYCGGIFCCNDSNPILINSILWNYNEDIYFSYMGNPNSITISYSDIQGGEAGIVTNSNGTVNWLEGNID